MSVPEAENASFGVFTNLVRSLGMYLTAQGLLLYAAGMPSWRRREGFLAARRRHLAAAKKGRQRQIEILNFVILLIYNNLTTSPTIALYENILWLTENIALTEGVARNRILQSIKQKNLFSGWILFASDVIIL